ncbi:MAG: phospholipase D-like domain-containing protein [Dehalococcoidia bacterium]|nr:phospholipase D-like domain-containing protein [Dehalococcoidia bacterium]
MTSIIDNKERKMVEALRNSLQQAERVDILTAFFYFSGFELLAEELKDKKIRILVGNTIDPETISELSKSIKNNQNPKLERYVSRSYDELSNLLKREQYIESFIGLFNQSALSEQFDGTESQKVFKMFLDKLSNGTLEIRLTNEDNHAKAYILTNKREFSCNGDQRGVIFMGSSNFTYSGLLGQGEVNKRFSDNADYEEHSQLFESLWNDSNAINICVKDKNDDFVNEVKKKLWLYATPAPYSVFIRILFELYSSLDNCDVKNPKEISGGKFSNLKYQIDAIKLGVDCINKNDGVIIADVVGLGKSIIASAIAHNLDIGKTVIIAPPHLCDQWDEYQQDFGLRGAKVWSSGKIEAAYQEYATDPKPILFIIDEAHRYRNELCETYQYLHQLTRSNPNNKVILLTATPYNNRPQDLFALVKLFQTPSRSTISSVDNLSVRFHELIAKYNRLEKEGKKSLTPEIKVELEILSQQLRTLIAPVVVRRSRIDLKEIKEYAEDLEIQGIKFPEVVGPNLLQYDLGSIESLYISTLERLLNNFEAARYNSTGYLENPAEFMEKYGELFEDTDISQAQKNLASFVRRLLVMRFESSKAAFKVTLDNILLSYTNIKKWWENDYVPIKKKGSMPDFDEQEIEETLAEIGDLDGEGIDLNKIKKKAIPIPAAMFKPEYICKIEQDIELLTSIKNEWFSCDELGDDPKFTRVKEQITALLKENKRRKIVIFSTFADTAKYVKESLTAAGFRAFLYTGGSEKSDRIVVKANFDASFATEMQKDDYDIIVATDALSEGFNLNRAGAIINYDIPYNPTRVVQRIGRINRINKKMFDEICIFNLFPTDIGERVTLIRGISKLKMLLINNIVGSDTKTLTPDETLESYFKNQFLEADNEASERSWDNDYRNIYNGIRHNADLLAEVNRIPARARIVRKGSKEEVAISFAKRGNNALFALALPHMSEAELLPVETVLAHFKAERNETGYPFDEEVDKKFAILRAEILRSYPKNKLVPKRGKAITNLEKLLAAYPLEKDYINDLIEVIKIYDDLSDGELKYIANFRIRKDNLREVVAELKEKVPERYIMSIKKKVSGIDAQVEVIMFTEDIRK